LVILAVASLTVEIQLVSGIKITSPLYLWTVPAWLAWYLLAVGFPRAANGSDSFALKKL
jgi:hypothetical protein